MTIQQTARRAARLLGDAGVPDPRRDAELLVSSLTGLSPMELRLNAGEPFPVEQEQRLSSLLLSRARREPLQYLLHEQWFYGLCFYVDANVLIPRQETETLCELGLTALRRAASPVALDLCTGSGAVAITLKHECPQAFVTAVDISAPALAVAEKNARRQGAEIELRQGDLFAPVDGRRFSVILSNPPYIQSAALQTLQAEVRREPRLALDGGADGLAFYRRIAAEAGGHLLPGGFVAVEVGDGQAEEVALLFERAGHYDGVQVHVDLYGARRVVSARAANPA